MRRFCGSCDCPCARNGPTNGVSSRHPPSSLAPPQAAHRQASEAYRCYQRFSARAKSEDDNVHHRFDVFANEASTREVQIKRSDDRFKGHAEGHWAKPKRNEYKTYASFVYDGTQHPDTVACPVKKAALIKGAAEKKAGEKKRGDAAMAKAAQGAPEAAEKDVAEVEAVKAASKLPGEAGVR